MGSIGSAFSGCGEGSRGILRALQPPMCRLFVVAQPGGQNASLTSQTDFRPPNTPTTSIAMSHRVLARCYTEYAIQSTEYAICLEPGASGAGGNRSLCHDQIGSWHSTPGPRKKRSKLTAATGWP